MIRLLPLLAALIALLLAADAGGWWWVTDRMARTLDAWQAAQTAQGSVVRFDVAGRGGWPLRAELLLHDVTLATDAPGAPDAVAWQAGQLRLVWTPWRPWQVDAVVEGGQSARFGASAAVPIAADPLDIAIPIGSAGDAQGVELRAAGLSVPVQAGPLVTGPVHFGSFALRLHESDAVLTAGSVTVPGALPFGGTIQSVSLRARLTGPLPAMRDPAAALAAWRDAGQRLMVDDLAVHWGPLDLRGHADLGLDAAMQPEGSAAVQLTGFAELIDALARAGAISRNDARVAATLLGLMARPGPGGAKEVDLPLTLHDRTLSAGAIPLLRLRTLAVP